MKSRLPGRRRARPPRADGENVALPRWLVVAFAYALFLYSCCVLTSLALVTPDLLVSVFVFLLAAWTSAPGASPPDWPGRWFSG